MGFTDDCDICAFFHEDGFTRIVDHIRSQRPSPFNCATPEMAQNPRLVGRAIEGCGCDGEPAARVVSPEGHVLFHASSRNGYAVTAASEAGELDFDSREVGDDDLFAVSQLEPATYSMRNTAGKAAGEIVVVSPTTKGSERMKDLETHCVDATRNDPLPLSMSERKAAAVRLIAMFPDRSISVCRRPSARTGWTLITSRLHAVIYVDPEVQLCVGPVITSGEHLICYW